MAGESPELRRAVGRAAAAKRWNKSDLIDRQRELAESRIAEFVRKIVDQAPPLAPEQRDRISALLVAAA
ncbi:hypothetical protein [Prescottella defluvii]|uniref:hypothetical protein n=1 Tax=Prescottella defluvii TaxID=1323361 RepID=UPI000B00E4B0|nr:hypothetical protein [Prescottella defluvii]